MSIINNKSFDDIYDAYVGPVIEKLGYAKVWWLGRWTVHIVDFNMVDEIYKSTDVFYKSFFEVNNYGLIQMIFNNSNILASNKGTWLKYRKISNPALHKTFSTETIGHCVKEAVDLINSDLESIEICSLMQRTALDILGRAIFNYDIKALKEEDNKIVEMYKTIMLNSSNPVYLVFPFLDNIYKTFKRRQAYIAFNKFDKIMEEIILEKRNQMKLRKRLDSNIGLETDLILNFVVAYDEGEISMEEIKNNLLVFFIAGHDTTANSLSTILGYLCKHQEIQAKAREEVIKVMGDNPGSIPTNEDLNKMEYLMRIIKEGTRIATNFPTVERYTTGDYEFKNGLKVKKGTILTINHFGMHHDPKIYKNPYIFNPDRFISEISDKYWKPFADRSRTCIGINFSLAEQKTVLAMLLLNYNFKFSEKYNEKRNGLLLISSPVLLKPEKILVDFVRRI